MAYILCIIGIMDMPIEFPKSLDPGKCNFEVRKFKANLLNFLLAF